MTSLTQLMWSEWRPFPDPRKREFLIAPIGPSLYEIRRRSDGGLMILGRGNNCASRMSTLLPSPFGGGGRNNVRKREFMLLNLEDMDYRCCPLSSEEECRVAERILFESNRYLFHT
jgi:hypothetical protein